ncbi:hypothetical protein D9758_001216 [Tetrapyrgos nigripes]|uniref:Uncharacterized protein n=1 Tax=Tetrapyrgos nigripes TaxID=182062 RepID=A0A8H5GRI1_9AGAR|nr:hypothetical protein D9758_001216 [Tetrapyrgos nigripes]
MYSFMVSGVAIRVSRLLDIVDCGSSDRASDNRAYATTHPRKYRPTHSVVALFPDFPPTNCLWLSPQATQRNLVPHGTHLSGNELSVIAA